MRFRHHRSQQPRRQYDEHDATEKHSKRKASKSLPSALSAESKVSSTARSTIHAPSFILGVILMLLAKTLFVAIEQANSPVVANNNEAIGKTPIDNANGSEEGPLGSFKWKSIQIGKKSGEKLFWVQGKTNGEGHYFYERILICTFSSHFLSVSLTCSFSPLSLTLLSLLANGWLRARRQEEPGILLHFSSRVVPKITSDFKYFLPGQNIVNRIPGEYAIWSKEPLLKNLRDFASRHDGCDIRRVHPDSYILNEPIDCQSFFHPSTDTGSIYSTGIF
eukprot:jgi/Bigna1/82652/fgenesh1_pg.95_\